MNRFHLFLWLPPTIFGFLNLLNGTNRSYIDFFTAVVFLTFLVIVDTIRK